MNALPAEIRRGDRRRAIGLPMRASDALYGDLIICRGKYARVVDIIDYARGRHERSPILNDLPARLIVTDRGERWVGRAAVSNPPAV